MSGGWTVVDSGTNKSLPIQGTSNSGARVPYFAPAPGNQDPVGKMRMSTPQALIDTDFEYGTQPTKWESIGLQNNRQSVYYIGQQPIPGITSIAGDGSNPTLTILTSNTTGAAAGVPIFIQNSNSPAANGWWTITSFSAGVNIVCQIATGTSVPATNQYNAALTYAYIGYFYSGCGIQVGTGSGAAFTNSGTTVTGTTTNPHGLSAGSYIYVQGTTASSNPPNGAWVVATAPTANTFTFTVVNAPTGANITAAAGANVTLYARPSGFVEPRTFDGGVAFSAGGAVTDQQLIRQTRRYFRYQSGKGIQFSTGSSLKPALFVTSITGSTTTATVTSRYQHNLTVGAKIQVFGCDQGVYNGNFTVATVPSTTSFTYTTQVSVGANTTATGQAIRVSPLSWYGSANRVGLFDQQNGMFFEYDGQTLYAVLRNSINQANGTVSVTQGSSAVTGTGTQFSTQCTPGAFVVIRGQSYRVVSVASDTSMYVTPEYRGTTIAGALMSLTLETRIPQSSWQDPCNGTGPSGYTLDLTRMQMWYIDYSWYGAGVVRYGFRATNGQINYVTQIQNNNVQFEAYMRSGNMAAHYESNGLAPTTVITASLGNTNTTLSAAVADDQVTIISLTSVTNYNNTGVVKIDNELIYYSGISGSNLIGCIRGFGNTTAAAHINGSTVAISSIDILDCSRFPPSGTVKVQGAGQTGTIEYIAYTGNDGSILYGLTRAQTGGSAATAFSYSATAPVAVSLSSPDTVPSLSHWGSSVIMDGRFDDDKSLIFNYGQVTAVATSSTSPVCLLAIRIGPSVDNGQTGLLGSKEIINRMQLQLDSLGIVTTGNTYLINLILNGYSTGAFVGTGNDFRSPIQQANGITSSLAQVAVNTTGAVSVFGGESVAAAYCAAGTVSNLDLSQVRDLGNSILGGGTSNTIPTTAAGFYPDGPDILYVVAQAVSATGGTILARLSWKEAQA
jgi:hypothetical protein